MLNPLSHTTDEPPETGQKFTLERLTGWESWRHGGIRRGWSASQVSVTTLPPPAQAHQPSDTLVLPQLLCPVSSEYHL
jgi:hypothetical protein